MRMAALTEVRSAEHLQELRPKIEGILALPGMADAHGALSIRFGMNVANERPGDWSGLDRIGDLAGEIAAPFGCEVQLRGKHGRTTPRHGARRWGRHPGGNLGGTDVNLQPFDYPLPFDEIGEPEETFWLWMGRAARRIVSKTREIADRHGLPSDVVHGSHPGGTWAEVFIVEDMQRYQGYSPEVCVEVYSQNMQRLDLLTESYSEVALSGHVTPDSLDGYVFGALTNVAKASAALHVGRPGGICINRNDIRPVTRFDSMPTAYPLAWQSYASTATYAMDWDRIIGVEAFKRNVVYYEAYLDNFSTATGYGRLLRSVVAANAERFTRFPPTVTAPLEERMAEVISIRRDREVGKLVEAA